MGFLTCIKHEFSAGVSPKNSILIEDTQKQSQTLSKRPLVRLSTAIFDIAFRAVKVRGKVSRRVAPDRGRAASGRFAHPLRMLAALQGAPGFVSVLLPLTGWGSGLLSVLPFRGANHNGGACPPKPPQKNLYADYQPRRRRPDANRARCQQPNRRAVYLSPMKTQ